MGNPRQVIIDGTPYTLSFGEKMTVFIDGQAHLMEFGGPSRELYLGRQPLRGSFGGPPIVVKINGVEHRIQLTGPPPEVKIDPEPDYSLARYMQNRPLKLKKPLKVEPVEIPMPPTFQGAPNPMGFGPPPVQMLGAQGTSMGSAPGFLPYQQGPLQMAPPMGMGGMMGGPVPGQAGPVPNVQDLLSKLISAGMLKKQQEEMAAVSDATNFVVVEDLINKRTRGEATPNLKEFKMDLLKM